jgi:hypothetical protein
MLTPVTTKDGVGRVAGEGADDTPELQPRMGKPRRTEEGLALPFLEVLHGRGLDSNHQQETLLPGLSLGQLKLPDKPPQQPVVDFGRE